ncbi:MAG: aminopeptidase P family protein [Simkaniaceae bacterium]|nr:aminopeptidase P family protein [Simkaniaceae bacterium]
MIRKIQDVLKKQGIDGWLLYDFRSQNEHACTLLNIKKEAHLTRRFFYFIPQGGVPVKLVHQIESTALDHLEGERRTYFRWEDLKKELKGILKGVQTVAMEYSPMGSIPTLSVVDGGTLELVASCGVSIVSSAPFLQEFTCTLSAEELESHREAAALLNLVVDKVWGLLRAKKGVKETDVQAFMGDEIEKKGFLLDGNPICAFGKNGANPHHSSEPILAKEGDIVLIDLWCKKKGGVFADIARMGILANRASPKEEEIFQTIYRAQQASIKLIQERYAAHQVIRGYEADEAARAVIREKGYESYFTHRTGHNIFRSNHGPGANLDGLETYDDRPLIPRTCFSVEPGIYISGEVGMRLETDVYIHENGKVEVTAGLQDHLELLT